MNDAALIHEQRAYGVLFRNPANRFSKQFGDGQNTNLAAAPGVRPERYGVGNHEFVQHGAFDALHGGAGQYGMGAVSANLDGALRFERVGGFAEGVGGVHHVVDEDAGAAFDVADNIHDDRVIGTRSPFVDNGEIDLEPLGDGAGANDAAHIGGDDDQFRIALPPDIPQQNGRGVDVVHWNVKKTLNLIGVQIHGEDPAGTSAGDEVRDQFGGDGGPRTGLAILSGIAEIGHGRGDAVGGCAFQRVDHGEQFHEVIVGRRAGGLEHKDVPAAHVLQDLYENLAITECADFGTTDRNLQEARYLGGQYGVGVPAEDHEIAVGHVMRFPLRRWQNSPRIIWLGRQGSNLGMPESKSGALPLGDSPVVLPVTQRVMQLPARYKTRIIIGKDIINLSRLKLALKV